jgi:hypothetical protein
MIDLTTGDLHIVSKGDSRNDGGTNVSGKFRRVKGDPNDSSSTGISNAAGSGIGSADAPTERRNQ